MLLYFLGFWSWGSEIVQKAFGVFYKFVYLTFAVSTPTAFLCAFLYFFLFQSLQDVPHVTAMVLDVILVLQVTHSHGDMDLEFSGADGGRGPQLLESPASAVFPDLRICFLTIAEAVAVVAAWCGQNLSLGSVASLLSNYKLFYFRYLGKILCSTAELWVRLPWCLLHRLQTFWWLNGILAYSFLSQMPGTEWIINISFYFSPHDA